MKALAIAVLGDLSIDRPARRTVIPAIKHAAKAVNIKVSITLITDASLDYSSNQAFDGLFIAPGSPTEDVTSILQWVQMARERGIPCLGTCGGSQRMILEFAQNVLELPTLEHAEVNSNAVDPLFSQLLCGLESMQTKIKLVGGSKVLACYQRLSIEEEHYCGYGLNEKYVPQFEAKGLKIVGRTLDGEVRVIELEGHLFFVGTAFVPQVLSTECSPHPLIVSWLKASVSGQS